MSVFGRENKKRCLKGVTSVLLGFLVALLLLLLVAIHPWCKCSRSVPALQLLNCDELLHIFLPFLFLAFL